jgi:hypothetical protein
MPSLLSLPRELRDVIIDYVLVTPKPSSSIRLLPREPNDASPSLPIAYDREKTCIPMQPFRNPLLRTNAQLRAECQQRASSIKIPLVLEITLLQNGVLAHAWITRPWGEVANWAHIPEMKVRTRLQPVDVHLSLQPVDLHLSTKDKEKYTEYLDWWITELRSDIPQYTLWITSKALRTVLGGVAPGSKGADMSGSIPTSNKIARLTFELSATVDNTGKEICVPHDANADD